MKIFITGAAGYIGGMLTDLFLKDQSVEKVIALDFKDIKEATDRFSEKNPRLKWITWNLGDDGWQEKVLKEGPVDVVIHSAYVIRQGYGEGRKWQIKSNITAADNVFEFAFKNNVKKLIHFSTVASYGALKENSLDKWFKEEDLFKEEKYLYGVDKKIIEENLQRAFKNKKPLTKVVVIRPCAVTGPRGQNMFKRFGLIQMIKGGLPFVPVIGEKSARQYIHEDDVNEIVKMIIKEDMVQADYEVFNIAPPDYILLKNQARLMGKAVYKIPFWLGWLGFFLLWHLSRGRIPTVPEGIRSYTYPIIVDGSKITKTGFQYRYTNCVETLKANKGHYK